MTSRLRDTFRRFPDAVGLVALAVLAIWVFWPLLFGGQAYFFGDLELYFYPMSEFWHRELAEGRLPLWNPYVFGGVPFAGNPQIGLLYPPSILLALFPTVMAISFRLVLHFWGSAAVFFFWLRRGRLKLGAMASLLGAVCWMLGGAFFSKLQFPNMLAALAWMPAVLWATETLGERSSVRTAVVLGATLGLQLLAAHAQVSLYTLYLAFFYALWVWKTTPNRVSLWKLGTGFLAAGILAVLLDAGQILPVLENVRGAERQVLSLQTAPRFVLPPWALTNLFVPYLYGNPNSGTWTYHGGGNAWEAACTIGIVPFLLALLALKRARFWRWVALASVVLALGPLGGLYSLAFSLLPGLARFHDAARFLMLAGVAFPIMAALGFQGLCNRSHTKKWAPLLLLISALQLAIFARGFYPLRDKTQIAPSPNLISAQDLLLKTNQARIWCMKPKAARALLLDASNYRRRTAAHDAIFSASPVPNMNIWNGVVEAEGYDPIAPASVIARLKALEISPQATQFPPGYAQQLGQNSIRLLALWREKPLRPLPGLVEMYRGTSAIEGKRLFIYRNNLCRSRATFRTPDGKLYSSNLAATDAGSLQTEIPPGRLTSSQLEILDNFAPGWRAAENGAPINIRPTRRGYMQLDVLKTNSTRKIRLTYAPQSFRFGVFLSLSALSAVVGVFFATKKPKTK